MEAGERKAIQEVWEQGEYERCIMLAQEWKQRILQGSEPNVESLGWARYYELRSRWACKQWEEVCWELEREKESTFVLPSERMGELYELGVKAAAQLQRVDDVVGWGQKCLVFYRVAQRPERVGGCALLVCHFLHNLGEDRQNADFVRHLLEISYEAGDDVNVFWGYVYMFEHVQQTQRVEWMKELIRALSVLVHLREIAEEESIDLVSKIRGASWFDSMVEEMRKKEGLLEESAVTELSKQSDPFRAGTGTIQWS